MTRQTVMFDFPSSVDNSTQVLKSCSIFIELSGTISNFMQSPNIFDNRFWQIIDIFL